MTIEAARKLLGQTAQHLTDSEIKQDIEIATLFRDIFWEAISSNSQSHILCDNCFNVNKT